MGGYDYYGGVADQVARLERGMEQAERAWERQEDRLIKELNEAKARVRELELEVIRLGGQP